jgi:hypothetical protein
MSDEPKAGTMTITSNATCRLMIDLDGIRESTGMGDPSEAFLPMAIARTLLAEIDRLSERVVAIEAHMKARNL